ncbi:YsnF/AvaK domain-containing protein [Niallia sp. NCCP-28]|uniref:YsnF/AvaK domain-containing protein n=1 Tax=Niallia sp. NCCP-28 TaxID=2934712 RepID=UPI00208B40DA|nr:YsnF/AvaK domain-containing protein [Niallia sp. NCCP-28]GKU81488.1 stress response protein YsnF [Niallia sp. NCCP-28]
MARYVIGVYETPEETISAIEGFTDKGHESASFSVITDRKDTDYLETQTNADVYQATEIKDKESESFFEKLKDFFTMDDLGLAGNSLNHLDLSKEEIDKYNMELENGKFLLVKSDTTETDNLYGEDFPPDSHAVADVSNNQQNYRTKEEKIMPIREEELNIDRENVQTGEIQVSKEVVTEEKKIDVPVKHDEVYVERRPVSDSSGKVSPVSDSETIRVPIVEERLEVTKKPVVTEEIVVGKQTVEENEHISETVRKEKARFNKEGNVRGAEEDNLTKK